MTNAITLNSETAYSLALPDNDRQWREAATAWLLNFDSENTRATYARSWSSFIAFAGVHPAQVTQDNVIAFKVSMTEAGLSQSTMNLKLSAISSFYTFAKERGLVESNPVNGVKRRNVNPYGKATALNPDEDEHVRLLSAVDQSTVMGKRDFAILLIFLTTGVRVSALAHLTMRDIEKRGSKTVFRYTAKRGVEASATIEPVAMKALDAYLYERGGLTPDSPVFVATRNGDKPLSRQSIYNLVKHYAEKAGFANITPHSLRHTVAVRLAKEGTLAEIAAVLGHTNTRVTTIYLDHVNKASTAKLTKSLASDFDGLQDADDDSVELVYSEREGRWFKQHKF